jgi:hypothetical protein
MTRSRKLVACVPQLLARQQWTHAARNAIKVNPANRSPDLDKSTLRPGSQGERLALDVTHYWGKDGMHLTVGFIDTADTALPKRILEHMNAWSMRANVNVVES